MARQRRKRAQQPTVLVVADEPTVRSLVESILQDIDYATFSAANTREALVLLQDKAPINLSFTDINMPDGPAGLDELELARWATELRQELSVP